GYPQSSLCEQTDSIFDGEMVLTVISTNSGSPDTFVEGTLNHAARIFYYRTMETSARPRGHKWIPILHLDSYQSLTKAMAALEKRGEPGLFRVVQMQRCVWAEMIEGKLR